MVCTFLIRLLGYQLSQADQVDPFCHRFMSAQCHPLVPNYSPRGQQAIPPNSTIFKYMLPDGFLWHSDFTKFNFSRGSYDAPPEPLVGCGGGLTLPLPIPHPLTDTPVRRCLQLYCTSVRPSTKSFFDFNDIWCM